PGESPAILAAGGALPFGLRGKAHAERAGEGVRFVPAHSHDRLIRTEIVAPCLLIPESRSRYGIRFPPLPAGVAPYAAIAVPATAHECVELAVGDRGFSDAVGPGRDAPPRTLVVLAFWRVASHPELARRYGAHPHRGIETRKAPGAEPGAFRCAGTAGTTSTQRELPLVGVRDILAEVVVACVAGRAGNWPAERVAGPRSRLR